MMVGREAYENPWFLRDADERIFGDTNGDEIHHDSSRIPSPLRGSKMTSRKALLEAYLPYVEMEAARGTPATILVRHLYGLFNGKPGTRKFRQYLGENAPKTNNPADMIRRAMDLVTEP